MEVPAALTRKPVSVSPTWLPVGPPAHGSWEAADEGPNTWVPTHRGKSRLLSTCLPLSLLFSNKIKANQLKKLEKMNPGSLSQSVYSCIFNGVSGVGILNFFSTHF